MIFNSRTGKPKNALLRKLMRARTLEEALDFKYLRRVSKNGQVCYVSKKRLQMLQRCGERVARFNEKMRERRKREAATARRLLGGKGNHKRAEIAREIWKHRPRAPIGSLATDRALIAAMWPVAWRSAREIGERIDWTKFRSARSGRSPFRLFGPLKRLMAHGMAEKTARGRNYAKGVRGRVSAHFFRLTSTGFDLRMEIEIGIVPVWRSPPARVSHRPAGHSHGERKTLCAMTPGEWCSVGDICLVLGWPRLNGPKRRTVDNALARLVPVGMVKRAQNRDWVKLAPWEPKYFYRLTVRGERLREGLMLIG